jgi:hypothetical protein
MSKLTSISFASGVTENDLIHIVITGDTSQNPLGSSYKTNLGQIKTLFTDVYVTGGTYSAGTATFTNNTGGTFSVNGFSTLVDVTFNDLVNLISSNLLVAGGFYQITDFQTIYDQPDFDSLGNPKGIVSTLYGSVEPLIVKAITNNEISNQVLSSVYGSDVLLYDWTFQTTEVMGVSAKGRITQRIDNFNNKTPYDHRVVLFKRYETINGSGVYDSYKDTGFASDSSIPTFGIDSYNNNIPFYYNPGLVFLLPNNIIGDNAIDNTIGDLFFNNTIGDYFLSNVVSDDFNSNTILDGFNSNTISRSFIENNIGIAVYSNFFGELCQRNVIANNFQYNNLGDYFQDNIIDDDFLHNIIDNLFTFNIIGQTFQYNTIGNTCDTNNIGQLFEYNQIGNRFRGNTIGNEFKNNLIGNYFGENSNGNIIGTNFQGNSILDNFGIDSLNNPYPNTIDNDFKNNQIGNFFYDNTIGDNFQKNVIGVEFGSNTINNGEFYRNKIGDNFYNNTIDINFNDNTIGNYFQDNIISFDFKNNNIKDYFGTDGINTPGLGNVITDNCIDNNIGSYFYSNTIIGQFAYNLISSSFDNNNLDSFLNNKTSAFFSTNTIGYYCVNNDFKGGVYGITAGFNFKYNTITNEFANHTILNNFQQNLIETQIPNSTDFSTATRVYGVYNCRIFRGTANNYVLSYYTAISQLYTTITA